MKIRTIFALSISLALLSGCASSRPTPPPPRVEHPITFRHEVKYSGETLGQLADWYLGDSKLWVEIQKVNPGINPNKIKIGDTILIPSAFAKRAEPYRKPKKKTSATPKPEVKSEVKAESEQPQVKEDAKAPDSETTDPVPTVAATVPEVAAPIVPKEEELADPNQGSKEDKDREALREKTRQELLQEVLAGEGNTTP